LILIVKLKQTCVFDRIKQLVFNRLIPLIPKYYYLLKSLLESLFFYSFLLQYRHSNIDDDYLWGFEDDETLSRLNPDNKDEEDKNDEHLQLPRLDLTQCLQETLVKTTSLVNIQPKKISFWRRTW